MIESLSRVFGIASDERELDNSLRPPFTRSLQHRWRWVVEHGICVLLGKWLGGVFP
jgi:hypothetical protein